MALSEFGKLYKDELAKLVSIERKTIDFLRDLAYERKDEAVNILNAIILHIQSCAYTSRLPTLYLIDNILKTVKDPYVNLIKPSIAQLFGFVWDGAAAAGDRAIQERLKKLANSWTDLLPPDILQQIQGKMALPVRQPLLPSSAAGMVNYSQSSYQHIQAGGHPVINHTVRPPGSVVPAPPLAAPGLQPAATLLGSSAVLPSYVAPPFLPHTIRPAFSFLPAMPQYQLPPPPHPAVVSSYVALARPTAQVMVPGPGIVGQFPPAMPAPLPAPVASVGPGMMPAPAPLPLHGGAGQTAAQVVHAHAAAAYTAPAHAVPHSAGNSGQPVEDLMSAWRELGNTIGVDLMGPSAKSQGRPAPSAPAQRSSKFDVNALKVFDQGAVDALIRSSDETRPKFIDLQFLKNRRLKSQTAMSRQWYVSVDDWLAGTAAEAEAAFDFFEEEAPADEQAVQQHLVEEDPSQPECAVSGERFERVYDPEEDKWYYEDAMVLSGEEAARWGVMDGSIVKVHSLAGAPSRASLAVKGAARGEGTSGQDNVTADMMAAAAEAVADSNAAPAGAGPQPPSVQLPASSPPLTRAPESKDSQAVVPPDVDTPEPESSEGIVSPALLLEDADAESPEGRASAVPSAGVTSTGEKRKLEEMAGEASEAGEGSGVGSEGQAGPGHVGGADSCNGGLDVAADPHFLGDVVIKTEPGTSQPGPLKKVKV